MEVDAGQSVLGKRPHGGSSSGAGAGAKRPRGSKVPLPALTYYVGHSDPEIQASAKKLVENVPTYEGHLQQYIDAEDPDNGIEDEYHPKLLRMLPGMQLLSSVGLFTAATSLPPLFLVGYSRLTRVLILLPLTQLSTLLLLFAVLVLCVTCWFILLSMRSSARQRLLLARTASPGGEATEHAGAHVGRRHRQGPASPGRQWQWQW